MKAIDKKNPSEVSKLPQRAQDLRRFYKSLTIKTFLSLRFRDKSPLLNIHNYTVDWQVCGCVLVCAHDGRLFRDSMVNEYVIYRNFPRREVVDFQ